MNSGPFRTSMIELFAIRVSNFKVVNYSCKKVLLLYFTGSKMYLCR